jgi:dUTP pyrophosphatase
MGEPSVLDDESTLSRIEVGKRLDALGSGAKPEPYSASRPKPTDDRATTTIPFTNHRGEPCPVEVFDAAPRQVKPTDDWCVDCGRQTPHAGMSDAVCEQCRAWRSGAPQTSIQQPELQALRDNLRATQERCTAMLMERRNGPGAIRAKRLTATAILPKRAHPTDSGLDLHADIDAPVHIMAGTTRLIPTGIAVAIPPGYEGQVRPRSGLAVRSSAAAFLGTIDSAYRGAVGVIMHAHGPHSITVKPGDRIGQLVIAPVVLADLVEVDVLDETERGESGFGSTGTGAR